MLKVKILAHTPNPEKTVASAARLCYSPMNIDDLVENYTDEENIKMIERLVALGHESPLEHVSFTFAVEGVSRSLTHQLVRHRIASFSQKSQRYVKEVQFEYIIPVEIERFSWIKTEYIDMMEDAQDNYNEIVDGLLYEYFTEHLSKHNQTLYERYKDKAAYTNFLSLGYDDFNKIFPNTLSRQKYSELEKTAIENARYVLPNAAETKIMFTMNARTLLNFFELRTCNRSQTEIRELADEMLRQVRKVSPILFARAGASCTFGKCREGKMSCGKIRKREDYD